MDATFFSLGRFAIDVALKVTLLVSLVLLLIAGLRRLSASSRHLLAMLGLAGALALPFVGLLAPSVAVPLVPSILPAPAPRAESVGARASGRAVEAMKPSDSRAEENDNAVTPATLDASE